MIRLDALKIRQPCPGGADIDRQASFCHTCSTRVHDLSAMTESEAEALLDANRGRPICVSYRRDRDGRPIFAAEIERQRWPVIVLGLCLAACTPWGIDAPLAAAPGQGGGECVLVDEGVWECTDDTIAQWVEPEAELDEAVEGCGHAEVDYQSHVGGGVAGPLEHEVEVDLEELPQIEPAGPVVQLDFEIDPDERFLRGMIVAVEGHQLGERLEYTPTIDLWRAWKEKQAERKAQRELRRARRTRLRGD